MKKKKVYRSRALNLLVYLEKLTWLIPAAFFIKCFIEGGDVRREVLAADDSLVVVIAILICCAIYAFISSIVPFLAVKLLLRSARKQMLRNNTFITVEDFDYYRDKLDGLSPGAISLISDLKLEPRKDIAASILKYKEMGILTEENGKYHADYLEQSSLKESDRYLINKLVQGSQGIEYDKEWKRLVEKEAINDGYMIRKGKSEKKGSASCCLAALIPVILFIIIVVMTYTLNEKMTPVLEILEQAPEDALLGEQLEYLSNYPEHYSLIAGMVIYILLFFLFLASPLAGIASLIGRAANVKWFKRTALGNEMAECIYGMKNFIHDYSNLSEADQEQVVLWDDYLIYAVVLEENQKIIEDIMKRRNVR
ncbi:MAG: DUF2207 domain-containing protein [Lachnospiraceae bacterium]|nr:DUF2207 domain-containing protein [Lachnospiraceae bacterium]